MVHIFKAKRPLLDKDPRKPLTRFKQCHDRAAPTVGTNGGLDPREVLTRSDQRHLRPPVSQGPRPIAPRRVRKLDIAAQLHASDPISVDVLHRALPIRSAAISG